MLLNIISNNHQQLYWTAVAHCAEQKFSHVRIWIDINQVLCSWDLSSTLRSHLRKRRASYHGKGAAFVIVLTICLRKWKLTNHQWNYKRQRGKFQSQQLSLLTHFNLGEPDEQLPTHDFVGKCKGWSVLETDVRLTPSPPVPLSVIWMLSTSRAAFITELLNLGWAQLEFTATPRC